MERWDNHGPTVDAVKSTSNDDGGGPTRRWPFNQGTIIIETPKKKMKIRT
jgi:hypothetical protein